MNFLIISITRRCHVGRQPVMMSRIFASNSIFWWKARRGEKCAAIKARNVESTARDSRAASRESNLKIEFKLCGKAARAWRHVLKINLISFSVISPCSLLRTTVCSFLRNWSIKSKDNKSALNGGFT